MAMPPLLGVLQSTVSTALFVLHLQSDLLTVYVGGYPSKRYDFLMQRR